MSKGGGGSGSSTVTQEIDPDVKAGYLTNLDYARDVANQMGSRQFADFNPQYSSGEQQIMNAAQGGVGMHNLDTAADLTRAGAGYAPMMAGGISAGPAAMSGSTGYNAAQFGGASAGPAAMSQAAQANMGNIGQYYNPYQRDVIDATMADLEKGRQGAVQQMGQQAMAAKAFGGSRQGVAEALTNQAYGEQAGKTVSQMRAQGFDTAANLMQQDVARQQQTGLSNQAARNQMSQFNAGNMQQAGLSNMGALNQAGQFGANAMNTASLSNQSAMNQMNQYNAGLGQQAQLANQAAGMQGAQFRMGAAQQLGQMGQAQTAGQYQGGQAMMGLGQQRQAAAQQQLDAQRNLNLERLGIMQGALGLQPANLGGSTTQPMYQNTGANMMGGALGGYSMFGPIGAAGGALLGLL